MSTAQMTRLGALRTTAHEHYEQTEVGERVTTTYGIPGLRVVLDRGGYAPLFPGTGYELRPNDGWAVDRQGVDYGPGHFAHLVDETGAPARELPTEAGTVLLDRGHRYFLEQDRYGWTLYEV